MLLLGQHCGEAMASNLLNKGEPYLYDTPLGFALVGNVCKNGKHSSSVGVKQTKYCHTFCTRIVKSPINKVKSHKSVIINQSDLVVNKLESLVECPLPIAVPVCHKIVNIEAPASDRH